MFVGFIFQYYLQTYINNQCLSNNASCILIFLQCSLGVLWYSQILDRKYCSGWLPVTGPPTLKEVREFWTLLRITDKFDWCVAMVVYEKHTRNQNIYLTIFSSRLWNDSLTFTVFVTGSYSLPCCLCKSCEYDSHS